MTLEATATITPPPVTIVSGKGTGAAVTVTAATPTRVITHYTVVTNTQPKVITQTYVLSSQEQKGKMLISYDTASQSPRLPHQQLQQRLAGTGVATSSTGR